MSTFLLYFGWPNGSVWGNLAASAVCAAAVYFRVRTKLITHHAEALAQAARHHAEQLEQAERQHRELKAHIALTSAVQVPQALLDDIKASSRPSAVVPQKVADIKPGGDRL